jgi:hypothetical protein
VQLVWFGLVSFLRQKCVFGLFLFLFFYLLLVEGGGYLVEEGFHTGGEVWWGLWF